MQSHPVCHTVRQGELPAFHRTGGGLVYPFGQGQPPFPEGAIRQHHRAAVLPLVGAFHRRGIGGVDRRNGLVKEDFSLGQVLPATGAACLFGNGGGCGRVKGLSVFHRQAGHRPVVRHKGHRHGGKGLGPALLPGQSGKVLVSHGLGLVRVTHTVDSAQGIADKAVVLDRADIVLQVVDGIAQVVLRQKSTGDGPHLFGAGHFHHGTAIGQGVPAARNAAHGAVAGQPSLGGTLADHRLALAGNTAHEIRIFLQQVGGAAALAHRAQLHAAHNATGAFLFGLYRSLVGAAAHHNTGLVGHIQRAAAADPGIIFRVQVVLPGHGAGDAAGIQVGIHRPGVETVIDLAFGIAVGVLVGDILEQGSLAGVFGCPQQGITNLVHLLGDGFDVPDEGLGMVAGIGVKGVHPVGNGRQAAAEAVACGGDGVPVVQFHIGNRHRRLPVQRGIALGGGAASKAEAGTGTGLGLCLGFRLFVQFQRRGAVGLSMGFLTAVGSRFLRRGTVRLFRRRLCRCGGFGRDLRRGDRGRLRRRFRCGKRGGFRRGCGGTFRCRGGCGSVARLHCDIGGVGTTALGFPAHGSPGTRTAGGIPLPGQIGQGGDRQVLGADVHTVFHLLQQGLHGIAGAVHPVLQVGKPGIELTGGCRRVLGGLVHQALQGVQFPLQLLQGILAVLQHAGGFHLAHDAAAFLAGMDGAVVDAPFHISGLAACNTAHIVADVIVPHGAAVDTAPHHPRGIARHTADIGDVGGVFGGEQILDGQVVQLDVVLADRGVDFRLVGTLGDDPVVLPHQAAHEVIPVDAARHRAAGDDAGDGVGAGNAAHPAGSGDGTVDRAVADGAVVLPRQAAHSGAGAARLHGAAEVQIFHHGILLQVAEQTLYAAFRREGQPAEGMTAALQRTAEGGDAGEIAAAQVQIGGKDHRAAAAPAVQAAVPGQGFQLVNGGNFQGLGFGFGRPDRRCPQRCHHAQAGQRRKQAFYG